MIQAFPTTAQECFELGRRAARESAGLRHLDRLFEKHFESFGYDAERFKRLTVNQLRSRASWQFALDCLMRAVTLEPHNAAFRHQLALVLEEVLLIDDALLMRQRIESIDFQSHENITALARLLEMKFATKQDSAAELNWFYGLISKSSPAYLLALARLSVSQGPNALVGITIAQLRKQIQDAALSSPRSVALKLALGFVLLATGNSAGARKNFLAASLLADQPDSITNEVDLWSLGYANAFLVGWIDDGSQPYSPFLSVDQTNLSIARAALLLGEGAVLHALDEYGAAISQIVPHVSNIGSRFYKGYRVVRHGERYYALPAAIEDFGFYQGIPLRTPPVVAKTGASLRRWIGNRLPRHGRTYVLNIMRSVKARIAPVARLPGIRFLAQHVRKQLNRRFLERYAILGVLEDTDVLMLRDRIDSVASVPLSKNAL